MNKKRKNIKMLITFAIVLLIILIVIAGYFIYKGINKTKNTDGKIQWITSTLDIWKNGNVENLNNVSWANIRINQDNNELNVRIQLDNNSETDKAEARTLTVNLLGKRGKKLFSKDVEMEEIENDGWAVLEFSLPIDEPVMIYDAQIIAK